MGIKHANKNILLRGGGITAIAKAAVTVLNFTTGYSNHKILSVGNWASKTWYTQ